MSDLARPQRRPQPGVGGGLPRPPGGGVPPAGAGAPRPPGGPGPGLPGPKSLLNPADAASQAQSGQIRPNMTVRDFLGSQGVDVDGPVSQLVKFAQGQVQNANPLNKLGQQGGAPGATPRPAAPPPRPGGLGAGAGARAPQPRQGLGDLVNQLGR